MLTLPLLMNYLKERLSNFAQLAILLANNLLTTTVVTFLLLEDRFLSAQIIVLYIAINYLLLFLSHLIIEDFRSMVSKINQDCLTSLNNQRRFHDDLQILNDLNDNITIALLDIDYFKK